MPAQAAPYRLFKPRIINDFQAAKYLVTSKTMLSRIGSSLQVIEKMEREMAFEPTASSLGIFVSIENKDPSHSRRSTQVQRNQQLPKFRVETAP
jgi:hypothetical protein